jgi:hypothetical protein
MTDSATDLDSDHLTDPLDGEPSSEPADGLGEPTASDYAAAAEQLAREAAQAPEQDGGDPVGAREQRYRQRAQAAEAERDGLAALVEGFQRAEVQRLAADVLADPGDLWLDGAQLSDLLDDSGRVDPGKFAGVVDRLLAAHPHWRKPLAPYSGPLHSGAANARAIDSPAPSFQSAFGPKRD